MEETPLQVAKMARAEMLGHARALHDVQARRGLRPELAAYAAPASRSGIAITQATLRRQQDQAKHADPLGAVAVDQHAAGEDADGLGRR